MSSVPDGKHVYVSSGRFQGDNAVAAYRLDAKGHLELLQEFQNGEGEFAGFEGGNDLAISPDGLNVYAAGTRSGSVACFRRDPETGKLTILETIADGGEAAEFSATGVCVSRDGKFVYVPTEDKKAISVFKRGGGEVRSMGFIACGRRPGRRRAPRRTGSLQSERPSDLTTLG